MSQRRDLDFILSVRGELEEDAIQGSDVKVRSQERKWGSR